MSRRLLPEQRKYLPLKITRAQKHDLRKVTKVPIRKAMTQSGQQSLDAHYWIQSNYCLILVAECSLLAGGHVKTLDADLSNRHNACD